ncbi:MAG: hypothetical protein ACYC4D_09735 [Thermoleophilia bacterium]
MTMPTGGPTAAASPPPTARRQADVSPTPLLRGEDAAEHERGAYNVSEVRLLLDQAPHVMVTAPARLNLADRRRQPEDTDCAIVVAASDYPGDPRY